MDVHEAIGRVARGFEGDADEAAAAFADDAWFRDNADQPVLVGRDEIRDHFQAYGGRRERVEIREVLVDGDRAAVAYTLRFRSDADAYGQHGVALVALADGRLTSWSGVWVETVEDLTAWDGD